MGIGRMGIGEQARRERIRRERARRAFCRFAEYVEPGWPAGARHLGLLGEYLDGVARYVETRGREGIGRLMVNMPPRYWKSTSASVLFPAFVLGRMPEKRVIVSSYNGSLAMGFSRRCRDLLSTTAYRALFGDLSASTERVGVSRESRSVEEWNLEGHRGGMVAAGVGGGLTGKGADVLIVDDPHKDRAEAESQVARDRVGSWWTSTAYTRLEDGAAAIVIQTRWHLDDLSGRLLRAMVGEALTPDPSPIPMGEGGADQWVVLCMPALAEEWAAGREWVEGEAGGTPAVQEEEGESWGERVIQALREGWWLGADPLGRAPGEALWPEKAGVEVLLGIRANVGGYEFDALYQQRARKPKGDVIDVSGMRVVDAEVVGKGARRARYWDLAVSGKRRADWLAGARVARVDGQWFIEDVARFPGPWSKAKGKIEEVMLRDGPTVTQGVEISGQQGGYYQEWAEADSLAHLALEGVAPRDSKLVRANVWASRIEDGLVHLVRGAWNDAFVAECLAFPNGVHDDMVDAVSGAVQMLPGMARMSEVPQDGGRASRWDLFGEYTTDGGIHDGESGGRRDASGPGGYR